MAIGGYFELELRDGEEYHPDAVRLNSGCNAFEFILAARKFSKIYLPAYICGDVVTSTRKQGTPCEFYQVDENLEPIFDFDSLQDSEAFLFVNYFGLKDPTAVRLADKAANLIVDNAQAFFSAHIPDVDTFYSPRKFFGVPDGAYLYTNAQLEDPLEMDVSRSRMGHLLRRIEHGPEDGYPFYLENERGLENLPIRQMSRLTQRLLKNIDYQHVAKNRLTNYRILQDALASHNQLHLQWDGLQVPMVYPFLPEGESLARILLDEKIYISRYWPDVAQRADQYSWEYRLSEKLLPLPIDQRYSPSDMEMIIIVLNKYL